MKVADRLTLAQFDRQGDCRVFWTSTTEHCYIIMPNT